MSEIIDSDRLEADAHEAADRRETGLAIEKRLAKYSPLIREIWLTKYSNRWDKNERNARIAEMEQGEMA
jgi:hypothetical protein